MGCKEGRASQPASSWIGGESQEALVGYLVTLLHLGPQKGVRRPKKSPHSPTGH